MFRALMNILAGLGWFVLILFGIGIAAGVGYEWIAGLFVIILLAVYLSRKSNHKGNANDSSD